MSTHKSCNLGTDQCNVKLSVKFLSAGMVGEHKVHIIFTFNNIFSNGFG